MRTETETRIYNALESLTDHSETLFLTWHSPEAVARRAEVSVATARRHLKSLAAVKTVRKHEFPGGRVGYRTRHPTLGC